MSNSKKVIVITGASQGLGAGMVKAFRDLDYRVVATSRSIKPSTDPDILTVAGDIGDPAIAQRVIHEAIARFGRIDTLVNNAGIFVAKPFTAYTHEDYAAVLSVNLNGFFYITQLAITEMEKQGSGHVVNITTSLVDHAIDGVPSVLASLTKGGLNAATRSLAIEYAKRGIRVNAVSPVSSKPRCTAKKPMKRWGVCTRSGTWARSAISLRPSCIWTPPISSPVKSCTSMVVRAPVTKRCAQRSG